MSTSFEIEHYNSFENYETLNVEQENQTTTQGFDEFQ